MTLVALDTRPEVSILVPAKDEAENLPEFVRQVGEAMKAVPYACELVIVNDGSEDGSAQILENLNQFATHTPVTGAAVYGGVGMGPQEHAFRSGVDVMVATPGRSAPSEEKPRVVGCSKAMRSFCIPSPMSSTG